MSPPLYTEAGTCWFTFVRSVSLSFCLLRGFNCAVAGRPSRHERRWPNAGLCPFYDAEPTLAQYWVRPAFHGREIARGMDMRTDAKILIYVKIHEPFPWSRFRARNRALRENPWQTDLSAQGILSYDFILGGFPFRINRQIHKDKVQVTDLYPVGLHVTSCVKDKPYAR